MLTFMANKFPYVLTEYDKKKVTKTSKYSQ